MPMNHFNIASIYTVYEKFNEEDAEAAVVEITSFLIDLLFK